MDDYSDASFQIPTASSSNLLADDTVDFLDGVDMTMTLATPAAPTRTRPADSPLTLAELTPRSGRRSRAATPQVSLRRSPRKHRGTPAISSPLKQAVTADLSAAMEDTLSPFKRQPQEQSFQIPSIMNATTDLLLMDDGESMFGRDENATFGEGPSSVTMQGPPEPLTLSELNSPPKEPQHPPTIGSLSIPEEDDAEIAGNTPVWLDKYERPRSPSPALAPTTLSALQETVETAGHEDVAEEPRHAEVEVVPNSPPPQPVEVEEPASRGLINFPVDRMDAGILPAEPSSAVAAEEEAFPAPVPVREPSPARRISAKPQPPTVTGGAIVKRPKPRSSVATRNGATKTGRKTGPLRPPRTSSVVTADFSSNASSSHTGPSSHGLSAVSDLDAVSQEDGVPYGEELSPDVTGSSPSNDMQVDPPVLPSAPAPELQWDQEEAEAQASGTIDTLTDQNRDLDHPRTQDDHAADAPVSPSDDSPVPERPDEALDSVIQERDSLSVEPVQSDSMDVDTGEQTPTAPALRTDPPSPMRPPTKRSASAAENDSNLPEGEPRRKKAKAAPSIAAGDGRTTSRTIQPKAKPALATAALAAKRSVRVLRSSRLKNASSATSSLSKSSRSGDSSTGLSSSSGPRRAANIDVGDNSNSADAQKPAPRADAAKKPPRHGGHLTASSSGSSTLTVPVPSSLHASGSSSAQARATAGKSADGSQGAAKRRPVVPLPAKSMGRSDGSASMRKAARMPIPERLTASQPSVTPKLTRPVEFHFHSDARIEARKAGEGSGSTAQRPRDPALAIPDFAALQAQHAEAVAAGCRQAMHPTVPAPLPLHTQARAAERERFDDARRAREAELEAQAAEQRRLLALAEEAEVRELRRRAVPRANEVPGWYARAPKRSRDATT